MPASPSPQPVSAYLVLLILGFIPVALVALFYDDLPHRFVIQWSEAGLSITGTRAKSAMTVAIVGAAVAAFAVLVTALQNASFKASGIRRLFLALNFAQVITIGLTVGMIVGEALGFPIRIRDMAAPSAALTLAIAALLCLRISGGAATAAGRVVFGLAGWVFVLGAIATVTLSAIFIGTPVAFGSMAVAAFIALLLAIPEGGDG